MPTEINRTRFSDRTVIGSGAQTVVLGDRNDRVISYADAGEPDPAQTDGAEGRVDAPIPLDETIDTLTGGKGADRLFGQQGQDVLTGGQGADTLAGGVGKDDLTGGQGRDVFLLSERDGARDMIRDFEAGTDVIDLFRDGDITFLGSAAFDGSEQAIRVVDRKRGVVVLVDDDGARRADLSARVWLKDGGTLDEDDFGFF